MFVRNLCFREENGKLRGNLKNIDNKSKITRKSNSNLKGNYS